MKEILLRYRNVQVHKFLMTYLIKPEIKNSSVCKYEGWEIQMLRVIL